MFFYAIAGLINAITSAFLGFFVYFKNQKANVNRIFVLFCLSIAIWGYAYFVWQISTAKEAALFWVRALMVGAIFMPITYFHFITVFLNIHQKKKKLLYFGYFLSFVFLVLNFTPLFIKSVESELSFPYWPKPGIAYHPFLLIFFLYFFYSWYLLFKALQQASKTAKVQIKYLLIGSMIGFFGGATNYFLWYNIPVPPFGSILITFFIILTAFAIIKYHLFEIRVILTELLVGIMGVILLVLPFLMLTNSLKIITFSILILFCIFSYYLIKATHQESRRREEAERLAIQERSLRLRTERLARSREQFLLSSQHYFRTPLTSIVGYLEMVLAEELYGKLPEKAKEKLTLAFQSTNELRKRIEESLNIAQFQTGKGILTFKETQIEDLVKKAIEDLRFQAEKKNLFLEVKLPREPLPKTKLDQERIIEALTHLIDNGIKHTQRGGISVGLEHLKEKNSILFWVKDTGIGISKEELPEVGQTPFERGKEAKKLTPLGKGIGLYLTRLIVRAHHGKIWAESEGMGKGSAFYVELPTGEK